MYEKTTFICSYILVIYYFIEKGKSENLKLFYTNVNTNFGYSYENK